MWAFRAFIRFTIHFRPHCMHAVCRCSLLLQLSHVAWSACLSVCRCVWWARGSTVQKQLNRLRCCLGGGADSFGSKEPCVRWIFRTTTGRGTFGGHGWQDGDVAFCLIVLVTCVWNWHDTIESSFKHSHDKWNWICRVCLKYCKGVHSSLLGH